MTFHFAYSGQQWRDIFTLCLKSCQRYTGATRIVVHHDRQDSGPHWDAARALGNIEWRHVPSGVADLRYRLQTLWEEGGFFCDLDCVFLKSFEKFRDTTAIIGTQCKQKKKLSTRLLAAKPGSEFIRAYLDDPLTNAWDISHRHAVSILNRPVFYPVAQSNKTFWSGGKTCLKNAHALHLWAEQKPEVTVDALRQTSLQPYVESVMDDRPQGTAQIHPGVILTFD